MRKILPRLIALILVAIVLGNPAVADACPNCKNALELSRAIAFGASVLLLMSMPFAIGAVWCVAMIKSNKASESRIRDHAPKRREC